MGVQTSTIFSAPQINTHSSPPSISCPLSAHCPDMTPVIHCGWCWAWCVRSSLANLGLDSRAGVSNPGRARLPPHHLFLHKAGHHVPCCPSAQRSTGQGMGDGARESCCSRTGSVSCSRHHWSPGRWSQHTQLCSRGLRVTLANLLHCSEGCLSLGDQM